MNHSKRALSISIDGTVRSSIGESSGSTLCRRSVGPLPPLNWHSVCVQRVLVNSAAGGLAVDVGNTSASIAMNGTFVAAETIGKPRKVDFIFEENGSSSKLGCTGVPLAQKLADALKQIRDLQRMLGKSGMDGSSSHN